jgi:hypothetical protein
MARKVKYGKVAIVVIITVLIWVWADLAQDETFIVRRATTISLAKTIDPSLLVTFEEEPSVDVCDIVLRGPASKITDLQRELNEGSLSFGFFFDPAREEAMAASGSYPLDIRSFLRSSITIKDRGLTVESCKPKSISVSIVKLVEKPLKVRCIDEDGIMIKDAIVEPPQVDMFVPGDWEGEKLTSDVRLTPREIAYARTAAIVKTPQIELAPRQFRTAPIAVKIKMPLEEGKLRGYNIPSATIGFVFSPVLQGKYRVELLNPQDMAIVRIKATTAAKTEYEKQPFQILLYILDGDQKQEGELSKKVVYNLPAEELIKDEIMLNQQPVTARFKLIPLPAEKPPPVGS